MRLVSKADRNPISVEGPELLNEALAELHRPFPLQELNNCCASLNEGAVYPSDDAFGFSCHLLAWSQPARHIGVLTPLLDTMS